ncbi:MAG: phospholipid carrier-dependent glycosyltransferase [Candidatus Viridilinea halotolerans]|uniref:Phospholipid carrier-dependent glycosyltransferase n=1 Tax=Candidatus Viridilinea halotolerans TaxID=2491704 RepID=A0A426TP14_9CHLR|nr:MAG: phospholipid carrier-dependent glycosyltransferase [Candidatus Viridilinea halotolerans]
MVLLQRWRPLVIPGVLLMVVVVLLWLLLRSAAPLQLVADAPEAAHFLSGFHLAEAGEEHTFRWSGPEARVVFHGASSGAHVLRLLLHESAAEAKTLALARQPEGGPLAAFALTSGWRVYHVLMPAGSLATSGGAPLPLDLQASLHRPGQTGDDLDLRLLGVPLASLQLQPLPAPNQTALPRTFALGWLLAVLAATFVWLSTLVRPQSQAAPRWAALLTLLGVGAFLLLWAWRDPYGLAWALPPMPWMLGTASLLLLLAWRGEAGRRRGEATARRACGGDGDSTTLNRCSPSPATRERGPGGEGHSSPWLTTPWPLFVGLVLLALAGGMLATQLPLAVGAGMALALGALLLLSAGPHGVGNNLWLPDGPDVNRQRAWLLLGLIFVLALALRLFRLDEMPFGLWRDEARHGLFAQRIRDYPAYRPIYIASERVNMPALGLYPFALALHLWGEQLWSMRIVTALAGALTVLPLYAFATLLSGQRSVGLLAALLLAASSWHITMSRFSFPTVFDPLLALSGLALILAVLLKLRMGYRATRDGPHPPAPSPTLWERGRRYQDSRQRTAPPASRFPLPASLLALIAAGSLLGLAVQTYHTGRVAPLVAAWLVFLLLCAYPRAWRTLLGGGVVVLLGLLLTLGPLLSYALNQPEAFNDRVGAVFLLSPEVLRAQAPLAALDDALQRHLLMFHVLGDENGRHHAPLHPMLDYVSGLGMLLGVAVLLRWWRDWRSLFLAGGLALGLLPSALAMDAPHAMRAFAAIGFVYVIVALGWVALWRSLGARCSRLRPSLARATAVALLSLSVALNANLYFVVMPPQHGVYLGFYPVQSRMGAYLRELADKQELPPQIFVGEGLQADPVFAFLTTGIAVERFAGAQLSAPAETGAIFFIGGYFVQDDLATLAPILGPDPTPVALGPMFPDGSRRTFYVYQVP